VTVKDRRGYLIRGAALRLRALPSRHVANGAVRLGFTDRVGRARFTYRLRAGVVGGQQLRYLTIATRASTPTRATTKSVTFCMPAAVAR
jgi:hypothetical protein